MKRSEWACYVLVGLAFAGMIDTAFVGLHSMGNWIIPCSVTGGCDQVLQSPYSRLGGISIAWFGFAFYFFVAGSGVFRLYGYDLFLRLVFPVSLLALAVTGYLVYLQALVLRAFCDYCLLSAVLVTTICGLSYFLRAPAGT
ncbi:MAG: vitamin K epoxide reductase family protein [Acidobacteriota bacterium]